MSDQVARTKVKVGKNYIIWSDDTITVQDVRISYPHLDKKWAKKPTDTPRWSCTAILPLATHQEAITAIYDWATAKVKELNKGKEIGDNLLFIRDGKPTKKPEYADSWIIVSGESDKEPVIVNPDKTKMPKEDIKSTFRAGHFIDKLIEPWFQNNEHGTRLNASLRSVRYRREGPEISQGGISEEDAISSFDDDDDGGFGSGDNPKNDTSSDDDYGGL